MTRLTDSFAQAHNYTLRKQQNALAQDKYNRVVEADNLKMQRDQQMRDILSESVTPSSPQLPQEEAMGPIPMYGSELPDYPAQEFRPAKMNMQNALGAMYEGGLGPEAMALEQKQRSRDASLPADWRTAMLYDKASPEQRESFDTTKRSQQWLDLGDTRVNQRTGEIRKISLKPGQKLDYLGDAAAERKIGGEIGDTKILLADMEANLPDLKNVVGELSELSKVATYTSTGMAKDMFLRQSGQEMSEGGVARKRYQAIVRTKILPLLRITFGAAFTVPEGEKLEATLGDPDGTPKEKQAVLDNFIESKIAQIKANALKVQKLEQSRGKSISLPEKKQKQDIKKIGDKTYVNIDGQWYEQ